MQAQTLEAQHEIEHQLKSESQSLQIQQFFRISQTRTIQSTPISGLEKLRLDDRVTIEEHFLRLSFRTKRHDRMSD